MKKSFLMILALLGLFAALTALPRELVVVEVATGTWCGYCPGAAMGCHDLLQNGHAVAVIKNHNGDNFANVYSNARNSYYSPSGYPTAYFDGQNPTAGGSASSSMYSNYLPKVNARLAVPSHYSISALGNQIGSGYLIAVNVSKPEADTNTNVRLHAVLTESDIPFTWGNQTTVDNVNRLMSPDQNGTPIDLDTGETTTVTLTIEPNSAWNIGNTEVIFFLQNNSTKEILQGVKYSLAALVGAYPLSHEQLDFPNMYVGGSSVIPVTIVNFQASPATGTISIDNPAFSCSETTFNIPAASSAIVEVSFTPTAAQNYTGTMTLTGNLYNHPNIEVPLSGTGFLNDPPIAQDVLVTGPPIINQELTAQYQFSDPDGDPEGESIYRWYRIINNVPQAIDGANELGYSPVEEDLDFPLAFEVTPVDEHGMPGDPVMSAYTLPIEVLPPPRNLEANLIPPNTVVLTWEYPAHYEGKGMVGYRLYRNGLTISTITNPNTLTFSDTYVPIGIHEYWICTLFNNPMMLSDPSNVVEINVGVANDDEIASAEFAVSVHPNPFRGNAEIGIQSKAGAAVEFSIYNTRGQLVRSFETTADAAGQAHLNWDGTDNNGSKAQSGVYYFRMSSSGRMKNGRIVLMK